MPLVNQINLFGCFLLLEPNKNNELSNFCENLSKPVSSSNGLKRFFLK